MEFQDDDSTEPGDIPIELESEMTVENEDGFAVAIDISSQPLKREKPDEDSSCSAETSIDSECHGSTLPPKRERLLQVPARTEIFLNDHGWDEEFDAGQGIQPAMTGAKRRPNFTHGELEALVQHMDAVLQLQQQGATWFQLQEAWDNAARHVNSVGHHRRSSREIKAKWRDLKSKVKCKAVSRTSGRRNHSVTLSSLEKKVLAVLNRSRNAVPPPTPSAPVKLVPKVVQPPIAKPEESVPLPPQTIIIETTSRRDSLLLQRKPSLETNNNNNNNNSSNNNNNNSSSNNNSNNSSNANSAKEWQGWEVQTAERNAELLSRRANVPGQASELAELSAEVAETGVWLATKRNEIAERSLALEERRTQIWERLVQLLENTS